MEYLRIVLTDTCYNTCLLVLHIKNAFHTFFYISAENYENKND